MTPPRQYVLYTFVSDNPTTADRPKDPAQRDPETGRLLGLVRALLDCGLAMVAALRERNAEAPPVAIALRFGTLSLALIITRITRGLMIAEALEARLLRRRPPAARPAERREPTTPRTRRPANRTPKRPEIDEAAELLGALPSARDIADRIRNRSVGAVIIEICRDLGISATHPLWPQIADVIRYHRGNLWRMMCVWRQRGAERAELDVLLATLPGHTPPLAAGTHPP